MTWCFAGVFPQSALRPVVPSVGEGEPAGERVTEGGGDEARLGLALSEAFDLLRRGGGAPWTSTKL